MKFTGKLDEETQGRVERCDLLLRSPARLAALYRTGLMGTPNELAFDRLAHLAAKILKVPLTIISLVSDTNQFFKAAYGLPPPFDSTREISIDDSICRYTLRNEPIISSDASRDPLLMHHPATKPWGVVALIALPMVDEDGHVLGAFCAVDTKVRAWNDEDIMLMRELTASVMTEIHLRTQVRELQAERDFRDRFVAALSHDLRTPLGVAKMSAELLEAEQDPAIRRRMSEMIVRNMDRADKMIQDLLDASRLKAGGSVPLKKEFCSLNEIVQSSINELESIHGGRFVLEKGSAEIHGQWDSIAIRRIVENLAGNAVKYGLPNTPIRLRTGAESGNAKLSVHNEGEPIPPENLKNLFQLFQRGESSSKSIARGWGIGLTLVKGLTEAHGGNIKVESKKTEGTTFTVTLPQN